MATVTKRWSFASDTEGWQLEVTGASGVSSGWSSADNATGDQSGSGCLYTRRYGKNLTAGTIRWYRTITPSSLGVPANAIVTKLRATYWARCSTYYVGSSSSKTVDPYIVVNGQTIYNSGGVTRYYSSTTSWAQHSNVWGFVLLRPSDSLTIYCEVKPCTGNSNSAEVILRVDAIEIELEYITPKSEPTGELTITVGTTNISEYVEAGSLRVSRGANGSVGQCSFRCGSTGWSDPLGTALEEGTSINVTIGSEKIFAGEITRVAISSQAGNVRYDVTARDTVGILARRAMPTASYTNTTVGAIVADVVQNKSGGILSSSTTYIIDSRQVSELTAKYQSVVDFLNTLATEYPAVWYVDSDKVLHWRAATTLEHSGRQYSVSPTQGEDAQLIDSISYDTDMATLANRVTTIAWTDAHSSGSTSITVSASGDDGHLWGQSVNQWPPQSSGGADTTSTTLTLWARCFPWSRSTDRISPSEAWTHTKWGSTWPPPYGELAQGASTVSSTYSGGTYWLVCIGLKFESAPSGNIRNVRVRFYADVVDYANYSGDNQNYIWVELSDETNYRTAVTEPTGWYSQVQLNGSSISALSIAQVQPGATVYLRCGIRYGTPGGSNWAQFNNIKVDFTYDDLDAPIYQETRGLIKFDTTTLSDTITATSGTLKLYCTEKTGTWNPQIQVRAVSPSIWPINESDWNAFNGDVLATISASGITAGQWASFSIPGQYISPLTQTAFALRISPDTAPPMDTDFQLRFTTYDDSQNPSNRPKLDITYQNYTPIVAQVTVDDTQSQSHYGIRELVIYRKGESAGDAEAAASEELARRAWPLEQVDFSSYAGAGVYPGQLIYLDLSPVLSAGHQLVTSLRMQLLANGMLMYTISCLGRMPRLEDMIIEALK